jgi:hypothetical protein
MWQAPSLELNATAGLRNIGSGNGVIEGLACASLSAMLETVNKC